MKILTVLIPLFLLAKVQLVEMIKQHESFVPFPYTDTRGLSIGYGTHLPLTRAEAELLLIHRLSIIKTKLKKYDWFSRLSEPRQKVILDMAYNLGIPKLLKFKTMIWCLGHGYYHAAANAMKKSLWYKQVGIRGKHLYKIMWKGE